MNLSCATRAKKKQQKKIVLWLSSWNETSWLGSPDWPTLTVQPCSSSQGIIIAEYTSLIGFTPSSPLVPLRLPPNGRCDSHLPASKASKQKRRTRTNKACERPVGVCPRGRPARRKRSCSDPLLLPSGAHASSGRLFF